MNKDSLEEIARLDEQMREISGLSRYTAGPQLDKDGLPIPDGIQSGYALSVLMGAIRARLERR